MRPLDEVIAAWRANPDADATIALCGLLGSSRREELAREVGGSAETWHSDNAAVMLAVGRMYLSAGMLAEAQAALVAAGKADGKDSRPFRYLGEVLLRRGDAVRSEKVLARAIQLGAKDEDTKLWHDRAVVYVGLQKRIGMEGVAAEVARSMPQPGSVPAPALPAAMPGSEDLTKPRQRNPLLGNRKPTLVGIPGPANLPSFGTPAPVRVGSSEAIRISDSDIVEESSPRLGSAGQLPSFRDSSDDEPTRVQDAMQFEEAITTVTPSPFAAQLAPAAALAAAAPAPSPGLYRSRPSPLPPRPLHASAPASPEPVRNEPPLPSWAPSSEPFASPATNGVSSLPPPPAFVAPAQRPAPAPAPSAASYASDVANPDPALVLSHLARVGVYEPGGGAEPAWEKPQKQKTRGVWTLLIATVLIAGGGIGAYEYAKRVKAERAQRAEALTAQVDKLLRTGKVEDLAATDEKLSEAFELDSLSRRAARLWLQNRVLGALWSSDEPRGIDSAVHRGRQVGLTEKELVFGKVASFLAEGDLAGGAALLPRWDKEAGKDPYYQLAGGAVLERAGDLRAIERYEAARNLAPDLAPAEILLARLVLLELGAEKGKPIVDSLKSKIGDQPSVRALYALAWVVDPLRAEELPVEAKLDPADHDKLPAPLRAVPAMVLAAQALQKQDLAAAAKEIESAIALSNTPALATGLGFLAIDAGNEIVARKAALRALQFAAMYPRARTLAARVALLGGRLEEAQKAIEELDPSAADVVTVRAVVAYETMEAGDLQTALSALGDEIKTRQAFRALVAAPGILLGTGRPPSAEQLEEMAHPSVPWGELVAADAALNAGDLALAEKLLEKRKGDDARSVHLLRLSRLKRYQRQMADALTVSAAALDGASMTAPLLIERVYALLANDDVKGSRDLIAKYPALLGPLTAWLNALVDAQAKQKAQAAARVAKLDPPTPEMPFALRVLVARALAAAGDKRAKPYVLALFKQAPKHPDLMLAADEL